LWAVNDGVTQTVIGGEGEDLFPMAATARAVSLVVEPVV